MAKIDKVQEVAVSKLIPYERNAKLHSATQVDQIAASIQEFGFISPCLIDKDFNIIAGHGRVEACKQLGIEKIPCVFIEGLTEAQRRAYILADNRLTELGEWDMGTVSSELKLLADAEFDIGITGFNVDDIVIDQEPVNDAETWDQIEKSMSEETRSHKGDIWQLGRHRLMVGDSTKPEDVQRLMNGAKADLLETDPPYNVAVSNAAGDIIENDDMDPAEFGDFLESCFLNASDALKNGGAFYIWHADSNGRTFRNACENAGLQIRQCLIWVKNHFTLSRSDYQWMHEPCLYGWKDGTKHFFQDTRKLTTIIKSVDVDTLTREELLNIIQEVKDQCTVLYADRPTKDDLHPTMKPIGLIIKQIKNSSSEGDIVLDLFGGSGTTLMACEQLNRICYMMECDPKYADVIIQRWEEETEGEAVCLKK